MAITGVYETVLYADDVAAATAFYADVLGLRLLDAPDELAAAFRLLRPRSDRPLGRTRRGELWPA